MLKSNNSKLRSKCPISCSLDIFGDKWSLLIIRDMVIEQKKTFKDFFSSNEKIASNILTSRLKSLEKIGIISKNSALNNKKTNIYKLTDSGLTLVPIILEMSIWSENNIFFYKKRSNPSSSSHNFPYDELNFGAEYTINDMIYLRGGLTSALLEEDSANKDETLFSTNFGAGLKYALYGVNMVVDYTYRGTDSFDPSSVLSLGLLF